MPTPADIPKAKNIRDLGIDPFGQRFDRTHTSKQIKDEYSNKENEELESLNIDHFIYYNYTFTVQQIFSVLYENNHGIKCSRMEEGVLAYKMHFNDDKYNLGKKKVFAVFSWKKTFREKKPL